MFERFNTREELYNYKLGSALKMEHTVLDMLDANAKEAKDPKLSQLFRHHQDETRQQIANIEQAFAVFGWDVDDSPCLWAEALEKEAKLTVKRTDDQLVDHVLLLGAGETEHHEIAVYEGLIIEARGMGREEVAMLLQQNLEQEQHTLDEVRSATARVAVAA
jgi:ferritin-like metal-binding protein YciE